MSENKEILHDAARKVITSNISKVVVESVNLCETMGIHPYETIDLIQIALRENLNATIVSERKTKKDFEETNL